MAIRIPYTFLRPAYFMQNFSTTLRDDLVNKNRIFLPASQAKFTLIDVADIGQVAARVLTNAADYANQAFDLTCNDHLDFREMAKKLSGRFILVMIMLHYLPRF